MIEQVKWQPTNEYAGSLLHITPEARRRLWNVGKGRLTYSQILDMLINSFANQPKVVNTCYIQETNQRLCKVPISKRVLNNFHAFSTKYRGKSNTDFLLFLVDEYEREHKQ